jgi:tetratricopeptide (TPR) repeat protein
MAASQQLGPNPEESAKNSSQRLDSWKEIAAYLKRDVRTVRRWEKSGRLPVHRHLHQKQATVYAYVSELDQWWNIDKGRLAELDAEAKALTDKQKRRMILVSLGVAAALVAGLAIWFLRSQPVLSFADRDWVLLTDFENNTGQARFDKALLAPLSISIGQSVHANVFPRGRVAEVLRRMGRSADSRIDEVLGREICQRENIRALIVESIAQTGNRYDLTARVVDPTSGNTAAAFEARTENEDNLLNALDSLATDIRRGLGESFYSIRQNRKPLPAITTSSFQALQLFVDAQGQWRGGHYQEAVTLYNSALKFDPDFAMAHAALGAAETSHIFYDPTQAREHYQKALQLTNRLTDREQRFIRAAYERALGDPRQAERLYAEYLKAYPDDFTVNYDLGRSMMEEGRYDDAENHFQEVLRIDPRNTNAHIGMATCLQAQGRFTDSVNEYRKSFQIQPDHEFSANLNQEYGFALLGAGDSAGALKTFQQAMDKPNMRWRALRSLALAAMLEGKFKQAEIYLEQSIIDTSVGNDSMSRGRSDWFLAQTRRARADNTGSLQALEADLQQLNHLSVFPTSFGARLGVEYARIGQLDKAAAILAKSQATANAQDPSDSTSLTVLEGEIELARGNYSQAINLLQQAASSYPSSGCLTGLSLARAQLMAGNLDAARATYENVLPRRSTCQAWEPETDWLVAHLHLAEIYVKLGQADKARQPLDKLLSMWKDADADLPAYQQAKTLRQSLTN